jgi:hypothetical protein
MPVLMTESDKIPCEMIAERVPDSVANERRRRLNAKHKEQGFKPPSKRYLKLQDWTVLVTNVKEADVSNSNIIRWYKMRWRIELIFKACKSHTGMLKIVGHKTNQHHAKALVLTWVLAMIILADRGCFAMANLCEEGGRGEGNGRGVNTEIGRLKIEICSSSIFKSISRMIFGFGFQIELAGAGMNLEEHWERTFQFHKKHNQTESQKNRTALFEILDSAMIIPS